MLKDKKSRYLFFRKTRKNKSRVEMVIIKVMAVLLKTKEDQIKMKEYVILNFNTFSVFLFASSTKEIIELIKSYSLTRRLKRLKIPKQLR